MRARTVHKLPSTTLKPRPFLLERRRVVGEGDRSTQGRLRRSVNSITIKSRSIDGMYILDYPCSLTDRALNFLSYLSDHLPQPRGSSLHYRCRAGALGWGAEVEFGVCKRQAPNGWVGVSQG